MKDDFYNLLAATKNKPPRDDIIVVMRDLNANVGANRRTLEHVMGNKGIGIRNDNEERFVDFCNTNHLVIEGTVEAQLILWQGLCWKTYGCQCLGCQ